MRKSQAVESESYYYSEKPIQIPNKSQTMNKIVQILLLSERLLNFTASVPNNNKRINTTIKMTTMMC